MSWYAFCASPQQQNLQRSGPRMAFYKARQNVCSYKIPLQSTQGSEVKPKQLSWESGVAYVRVARTSVGADGWGCWRWAWSGSSENDGLHSLTSNTTNSKAELLNLDASLLLNTWGCAFTLAYNNMFFFADPSALACQWAIWMLLGLELLLQAATLASHPLDLRCTFIVVLALLLVLAWTVVSFPQPPHNLAWTKLHHNFNRRLHDFRWQEKICHLISAATCVCWCCVCWSSAVWSCDGRVEGPFQQLSEHSDPATANKSRIGCCW